MTDPAELQADVYAGRASAYDELVSAEDVDANLADAIFRSAETEPAVAVDIGAGTGRITRLLRDRCGLVAASDLSAAMLAHAAKSGLDDLAVADATRLPLRTDVADIAVAGWVFAHFRLWLPDDWRTTAGAAVSEMRRVTRSGGRIVVIESLGTGTTAPAPPSEALGEFHEWLVVEEGLDVEIIETDYQFGSVEQAASVMSGFFGVAFGDLVRANRWTRVPEFTGVWSTTVD